MRPYLYTALIVLALASDAFAQQTATETLRQRDAAIRRLLTAGNGSLTPGQEASLKHLLAATFDFSGHARLVFGRHWETMSPEQRTEAVRLLTILLERSSLRNARRLSEERVEYFSETAEASGTSAVLTRVSRGSESWEVLYRLHRDEQGWKVVDIVVEGASTLESNRAAFYKEIKATGVAGLLAKLRAKAESEAGP